MKYSRQHILSRQCSVDPLRQSIQLKTYYRQSESWYLQACAYYQQGELDFASLHISREIQAYGSLCLDVIPKHPHFNSDKYENLKASMIQKTYEVQKMLDDIVSRMNLELEEEELLIELQGREAYTQNTLNHILPSVDVADDVQLALKQRLNLLRCNNTLHSPIEALTKEMKDILTLKSKTKEKKTVGRYYPQVATSTSCHNHEKPKSILEDIKSYGLTRTNIRRVVIVQDLIQQFTAIAHPNTIMKPNGIETCGVLAGKLKGSLLSITTLIIPKQTGTSDMCTMTNEEELFDYCISSDLLTLGWIHTHPEQTCFMSSIDLHTQCGFQCTLPEAISIVVAPKDPNKSLGVYRLTFPDGLELIQSCTAIGFHPHPSNCVIYSDAQLCEWEANLKTLIVDLR